jgi:hypothetical protein
LKLKSKYGDDVTPKERVEFARRICLEYQKKGYDLTLRQVYYQGVGRGLLESSQKSYDGLCDSLSDARMSGEFPLNWLVDRTRFTTIGDTTRCDTKVERALVRAAEMTREAPERFLRRARWFGQETHVSVLFEKEALSGIFESVCNRLGVSWLACKGDLSHSAIYEWLKHAAEAQGVDNPDGWRDGADSNHKGMARRSVILYFGDHDPKGVQIPRTIENTMKVFQRHMGIDLNLEVRRIALNMDQIEARNLPPFPAKPTSADYAKYCAEFGVEDAWELDALAPDELVEMVEGAVKPYFDEALFYKLQRDVETKRAEMRRLMRSQNWITSATSEEE